jgi:hypothetical protein
MVWPSFSLYNVVDMKKKIIPFLVLAFSLGTGACSCSGASGSSAVDLSLYADLDSSEYGAAISLFRKDMKTVAGSDDQGFVFTPAANVGRDDTDFGVAAYLYPDDDEKTSSSSAEESGPELYGVDGTIESVSFRANGVDGLSAKEFVSATEIANMSLKPSAGSSELSEVEVTDQSPNVYTVNKIDDYREYFDLSKALMTKKAFETAVNDVYGTEDWTMPRKGYRALAKEERTLVDSLFTGEKSLTERLCDSVDALVDEMMKTLGGTSDSTLTIAENGLGSYRLTYVPGIKTVARFLQGRVYASSLPRLAQIPLANDISSFFEAVSTWDSDFVFFFTADDFVSSTVDLNCETDQSKLEKSETIDYWNGLLSPGAYSLPDLRLSAFHLIGAMRPLQGEAAAITLPDLTDYSEVELPSAIE